MNLYKLRSDITLNLDTVTLIIDKGYAGAKHQLRIYTIDGQHNYELDNEDWTRLQLKLKEYIKC